MKIFNGKYFVDVEVSKEFAEQYRELEKQEYLLNRKESRRHQSLGEFCIPDTCKTEKVQISNELKTSLENLTERQCKVVIFHAVCQMSFNEIGKRLGIKKQSVYECYVSAIKKLRKFLKVP